MTTPIEGRPTVGEVSAAWEAEERAEALADLRADIAAVCEQFSSLVNGLRYLEVRLREIDEDADKLVADAD